MKELKYVEFIGNMCDQELLKACDVKFDARGVHFNWKVPDECSDEDEDDKASIDEEVFELISKVKSMTLDGE